MLSYSLSFYLFRSRPDLWPLFFHDVRRQNMRGSSNNRDTARKWDLSFRIVATIWRLCHGKEHDKKHANDEQLSRQIPSSLISVIPDQFPTSSSRSVIKLSEDYFNLKSVGKRTPIVRDRTHPFYFLNSLFSNLPLLETRVGLFRICFIIFSLFDRSS